MQFAAIGLAAPFLASWLDARGVSAAMIGVIVAAPSLAMILTTVPIGRRIDALGEPRRAIVALNAAVLGLNAVLAMVSGEWAILSVWTLGGVLVLAAAPAADALALGVTARRGSDWARLRMFGSLGFVLAMVGGGALYEHAGIGLFLAMLIGASLARLLAALALPDARDASPVPSRPTGRAAPGPPPGRSVRPVTSSPSGTGSLPSAPTESGTSVAVVPDGGRTANAPSRPGGLYRPGVLMTIAGAALINASHALFYTFGILIWARAGLGESLGGVLWSVGVVAEMALMWRFRAIAARLSARGCLLVAAVAGVLRWAIAANEPALGWLFAVQLLHALTFGLVFVATATFIARRVDEREAVRGQSLSATLAAGSMAASTWVAGVLFERSGAQAYVAMAGLCVVGGALVAASYRTGLD